MIAFACSKCGMKFRVKPEYAGRPTKCPACKQALVVPAFEPTQAFAAGDIDGTASSVDQAGVEGGVTLDPARGKAGQKSVAELLAGRAKKGERYVVEGEIARGGMGAVLRAVDCDIRREVAVKYLLDQADTRKKARFVEEAQITGQLEHPNIVPIHELGIDAQKRLFFAMKMVRGRSLADVLDALRKDPRGAEKEYPLNRLLNLFINVCHALAYAHSRKVIHRDLKPANIMLGDFGEVYVMDWGLAKVLGHEPVHAAPAASLAGSKVSTSREQEADLTQDGAILGTPMYMPPEQAAGRIEAIEPRSDVYSLGAILYEMLALQPPVERSGGAMAVLMRVVQGEVMPPEQRDPARARAGKVPRELSAIAMKALAKEPKDRYPSAEALRQDIERYQEGRSVSAKEDTRRELLWKFVKRNKGLSAGTVMALGVLFVSTVILAKALWDTRSANQKTQDALKLKDERTTAAVPALIRSAKLLANDGDTREAGKQLELVLEYASGNAEARLLKGQMFIAQKDFAAAQPELKAYLEQRPDDPGARELMRLTADGKSSDPAVLFALAGLFQQQKMFGLATGLHRDVARTVEARSQLLPMYRKQINDQWPKLGDSLKITPNGEFLLDVGHSKQVTSVEPLKGLPLNHLSLRMTGVRDLEPLRTMPLNYLNLQYTPITDLSPLKGLPLTFLDLGGCAEIEDLSPLKGMQLKYLNLIGCRRIQDLSPVRGMQLETLSLAQLTVPDLTVLEGMPLQELDLMLCDRVWDLRPLRRMPLKRLYLNGTSQVKDLSPLEGMNLEHIIVAPKAITRGMDVLRRMKSLKIIEVPGGLGRFSPEEFWKRYDAKEFK